MQNCTASSGRSMQLVFSFLRCTIALLLGISRPALASLCRDNAHGERDTRVTLPDVIKSTIWMSRNRTTRSCSSVAAPWSSAMGQTFQLTPKAAPFGLVRHPDAGQSQVHVALEPSHEEGPQLLEVVQSDPPNCCDLDEKKAKRYEGALPAFN